ncbi:MAG: restriction endonuclease [Dehalococcoidia bacterium]
MATLPDEVRAWLHSFGQEEQGRRFERLAMHWLRAMGFADVMQRTAPDGGRDLEATHGTTKWAFECKCYAGALPLRAVAPKFLQLSLVKEGLSPDFFVILALSHVTSSVADIARAQNVERSLKYSALIWSANDESIDDLILSYPKETLEFCATFGGIPDLVRTAYLAASEQFLDSYEPFGERLFARTASAIDSSRDGDHGTAMVDLALSLSPSDRPPRLNLVFAPDRPAPGLFDWRKPAFAEGIVESLASWGLEPSDVSPGSVTFVENWGLDRTMLLDWGAVIFSRSILEAGRELPMSEWLLPLKEQCVRLRNFSKRGLLPMPGHVAAELRTRASSRMADFRTFLKTPAVELDAHESPSTERSAFRTAALPITGPFEDYRSLAMSLGDALWHQGGGTDSLKENALRWDAPVIADGYLRSYALTTNWLFGPEARARSYSVFDDLLHSSAPDPSQDNRTLEDAIPFLDEVALLLNRLPRGTERDV